MKRRALRRIGLCLLSAALLLSGCRLSAAPAEKTAQAAFSAQIQEPSPGPTADGTAQETPAPSQEADGAAQETSAPSQETGSAAQETDGAAQETPAPSQAADGAAQQTPSDSGGGCDVDTLLAGMTLREKVGQLFIVTPDALDPAQARSSSTAGAVKVTDAMLAALADYPVGGIIMFSRNITSPEQITVFNAQLQQASAIPLFLSVDEEGGSVARLANHRAFTLPKYQSAAAVGSSGDPAQALDMGSTIGAYLARYGFNMDFAPVADVNTNPDNPVIGNRAFSSQASVAAQMASAMADGLKGQGIIPVFKHFPGHGDTAEDSHKGLAVTYKTAEEMAACEWLPFQQAGALDCVMVGHIAAPAVTGDLTPATMSYQLVTQVLKNQLGFQGLIVTDSLSMGAITGNFTSGQAALGALQAGCDLLLIPASLEEAFEAVVSAVEDGSLSMERLEDSVARILRFKAAYGLLPSD